MFRRHPVLIRRLPASLPPRAFQLPVPVQYFGPVIFREPRATDLRNLADRASGPSSVVPMRFQSE